MTCITLLHCYMCNRVLGWDVCTYDLIGTLGMVDFKRLQVRGLSHDMCDVGTSSHVL
jgi:hypothetical protein